MKRSNLLVVARLFSGLTDSLLNRHWEPRGVPAIYKLLEFLASRPEIRPIIVFTAKQPDDRITRLQWLDLPPLGRVLLLPYRRIGWGRWGRVVSVVTTEIEQTLWCLGLFLRYRVDTSYFTAANIVTAGLFARLHVGRVVLRMMGVFPYHRDIVRRRRGFTKWLFASPFDHVICTEDGSDPAALLPELLGKNVPVSIRLNGIDRPSVSPEEVETLRRDYHIPPGPVVLFAGRLEFYKGCHEFVAAAAATLSKRPDACSFVLVGDGTERQALEQSIAASAAPDRIILTGAVAQRQMPVFMKLADIYVSTNAYGNLSNVNLEALSMGCCLVLPQAGQEIDQTTAQLLPTGITARYDYSALPDSLVETMLRLLDDPQRRAKMRQDAAETAGRLLPTWRERLEVELKILLPGKD